MEFRPALVRAGSMNIRTYMYKTKHVCLCISYGARVLRQARRGRGGRKTR